MFGKEIWKEKGRSGSLRIVVVSVEVDVDVETELVDDETQDEKIDE